MNVVGGIDKVIPVNAYIPGCPVRPEAVLDGVVKLLNALKAPPKPVEPKPIEVKAVEAKPAAKEAAEIKSIEAKPNA
jgi:NADH:ubiquinone oxidoreductase subunit B-like Fe-S oxidoreductase